MSITDNHLLWLDLETTGSNAERDNIIEIGCILTTEALDVLGEYESLVLPTDEALGRLLRNPVVKDMHRANGLLDQMLMLESGRKPHAVAQELLAWLDEHTDQPVVLAGSGVGHFDRRFLKRWMPQVDRRLRHWCIDMGVIRRASEMWGATRPPVNFNDQKTHRALDDARCHLAEAQAYREIWQKVAA